MLCHCSQSGRSESKLFPKQTARATSWLTLAEPQRNAHSLQLFNLKETLPGCYTEHSPKIWEYKPLGIHEWEACSPWIRVEILNMGLFHYRSVFIAELTQRTCCSRSFSVNNFSPVLLYIRFCHSKLLFFIIVGEEWNKFTLEVFFHLSILTLQDESEDPNYT